MFQPSSQSLFRSISSLAHFKIHHQLPLNPRESRQLLNLLTTSFRQQLDQEHGSFAPETDGSHQPKSQATQPPPLKRRRSSTSARNERRPTDAHLHSILTNPLFSYGSGKASMQDGRRDPMDVFDEACAKGFMKMEYAVACLKAKKRSITESPILSLRDGMKESGAGLKILRWLSSNGMLKNSLFLDNQEFTTLLVEFLVAEDMHELVWNWTEKSIRQITPAKPKWRTQTAAILSIQLLTGLVKAQALLDSTSLDAAYLSLARAKRTLDDIHCPAQAILSRSGCFLSYQSSINASVHLPPSEAEYNLFLELIPAFTQRGNLHKAHLQLHHPSKPQAGPALKYLKSIKTGGRKSIFLNETAQAVDARQRTDDWRTIAIGLDAAKFLLERDQYGDAKWVMDFLQSAFPKELGLSGRHKHDFEQAKAEAESLELLQSLNLA